MRHAAKQTLDQSKAMAALEPRLSLSHTHKHTNMNRNIFFQRDSEAPSLGGLERHRLAFEVGQSQAPLLGVDVVLRIHSELRPVQHLLELTLAVLLLDPSVPVTSNTYHHIIIYHSIILLIALHSMIKDTHSYVSIYSFGVFRAWPQHRHVEKLRDADPFPLFFRQMTLTVRIRRPLCDLECLSWHSDHHLPGVSTSQSHVIN